MSVQKNIFFGAPSAAMVKSDGQKVAKWNDIKEPPIFMKLSVIVLTVICVFGGLLLIPSLSENFLKPAADALLTGKDYANAIFGSLKP